MDGINGITAGYSIAVLLPLLLMNRDWGFMSDSFLVVSLISVLVFSFFNFRPRGKAKCFAGDVGSVGIAFILLFAIGMLIVRTGDVTWLIFLLVYGVDGCLTICHYGAFDEETARMECTPKSRHDGKVRFLIGQFTPKRNFQLIDLTALPRPSFWKHKRDTREALAFMHIFHKEITKRIKPDDHIHTEYVPSQVFTEYLRYMFKLEGEIDVDGLIYKSSVNNNKCVVVFCNQKDSKDYFELVKIEDKII